MKKFDELPDLVLKNSYGCCRAEIKRILEDEINGRNRRPWGELEPFIAAAYHSVFVLNDEEIGGALTAYISNVCSRHGNVFRPETLEACEMVVIGAEARLQKTATDCAANRLKALSPGSEFTALVRAVVLADLTGECDPKMPELVHAIEEEFGDVQDMPVLSGEDLPLPPLYEYFIHRAKEICKKLF